MTHTPPRTLARWEQAEPGDIYCESEATLPALIIRIGTASDLNHAGIVVEPGPTFRCVEAVGIGVVEHDREPPRGYIVRVTDDPELRAAIVDAAQHLADVGSRYGWITLGWQAGRVMSRVRGLRWVGRLLQRATASAAGSDRGRICSEVAVEALRQAVWACPGDAANVVAAALAPLDGYQAWQVAPSDLFRALAGRGDRAEAVQGPVVATRSAA